MSRHEYEYIDRTVTHLEEDVSSASQEDVDVYLRELSFLSMELLTDYFRTEDSYNTIPEMIEKDQLEDWLRYVLLKRIAERKGLKVYFEDLKQQMGRVHG